MIRQLSDNSNKYSKLEVSCPVHEADTTRLHIDGSFYLGWNLPIQENMGGLEF